MATHTGSEGVVHIGTDAVGELRSYSFNETGEPIETTTLGDSAKTFVAGTTSWSGSCDVFWDENDTAQTALTTNASVTLKFYPEGATTGDKYFSGTALVTGIDRSAAQDGIVEASFSFTGTGALSLATA